MGIWDPGKMGGKGFLGGKGQGEINFELISKKLLVGVGESSVSKCGIIPHLLPFEFIAIPPKFVSKSRKRAMLFFRIWREFLKV
jgi:hypothetical protein